MSRIARVESLLLGDTHLVRLRTEDGLVGVGQSGCWGYPEAAHAIVEARFRPALVGRDSRRIEHLWGLLWRMGPFRGSILAGAVSAIDIALWDLEGKRRGVPVWQLLGGLCRERLRLHLLVLGWRSHDELAGWAREAKAEGYTAFKFDPFPAGWQDLTHAAVVGAVVDAVAAVREAVGDEVDLIPELHRLLPPLTALALLQELAPLRPLFVEDPIQIDSQEEMAALARRSPVPLAQGERLHSAWEFRDQLERGGVQVLRPDPTLAGGISGCRKICALAEAHHAPVCFHNFLGPVSSAAAACLSLATPNFVTHEWWPAAEEGEASSGLRTSWRREGGYLVPPDEPGLGVEAVDAELRPATVRARLHDVPLRRDGSVAYSV